MTILIALYCFSEPNKSILTPKSSKSVKNSPRYGHFDPNHEHIFSQYLIKISQNMLSKINNTMWLERYLESYEELSDILCVIESSEHELSLV